MNEADNHLQEPQSIDETGLSFGFLADLVLKIIYFATELTGQGVVEHVKLPFAHIVENLLAFLIKDGETGYHIPDQDPEALCEKLMLLLNDPHQRETMGLRAAKYAKDYAWENIAARIVDVYKSLVEGKEGISV